MRDSLYRHISQYVDIEANSMPRIFEYFETVNLKKKEIISELGEKCDYQYFVVKGCLHMYFIDDQGFEKTIQFAIEDWWIGDYLALHHESPTDYYIQAVENSKVLRLSKENQELLLQQFPSLEKYFRVMYQIGYGAAIRRLRYIFNYSKEEVFSLFQEHFPEFVKRVPQYLVATYLGLTPEYLSKIRAKKLS